MTFARPSLHGLTRLRDVDGAFTAELVQEPGRFGLGRVPARLAPDAVTSMVCGFCSTGCGLTVHLRDGVPVNLTPDPAYPVNLGMACPKGWEALTPLRGPDRATTPLWRMDGTLVPIDWDRAARVFCDGMRAVQARYGPESVAFLGTGQLPTEELAFLGAFAKLGMGMLHGDGNTRQCMATAATAYKESFGFDAPPFTYADFEQSDVIVLIGSNLCIAHPIMWQRVLRNPHRPAVLVVDPRATETATAATRHYAIRPKSDLVLLYGLANRLLARGAVDREFVARHTTGFDGFAAHVAGFPPERVCAATGLSADELDGFAATIARGRRVSFWWTMGVNQGHESTRTAQAIIDLALMTGNVGRPGTGANSITGQCNAMGSRLFSNTTTLLGGRSFGDASHRAEVATTLGIPLARIPDRDGLAYDQILDGIADGRIRGLWIVGTNTAHSWSDLGALHDVLGRLDFLVVQDMYHSTATARRADLVLPAAGWGEKDGTFINSERRIGLVKKVARAPGLALADFHIVRLLADAWGCGELFARWTSPEAVFGLLRALSRGRPCDFGGIAGYEALDVAGGIQWPCAEPAPPAAERRLFADGVFFHPGGRARFVWDEPAPLPEGPDADHPLLLLTGRGSSAQWHTQTRTGTSAVLRRLHPPDLYVEIATEDADALGIAAGDAVTVRSRRGACVARAVVGTTVRPGQVFMPMHHAATNLLTCTAVDPHSRQPSYKACAVRVERAPR